jgi:hypothetical protein
MWFPAGVPVEIVRRFHAETVKALATPPVKKLHRRSRLLPGRQLAGGVRRIPEEGHRAAGKHL